MPAKYNVEEIANFYIKLANSELVDDKLAEGITNLKLQKILYFAQVAHLSMKDHPLFNEDFEAWEYGPVIRIIYDKYSSFKNKPITKVEDVEIDPETRIFLESIWDIYGKYSASELVQISHNHRPWKEAYSKGENTKIKKKILKDYYMGIFQNA